MSIADLSKHTGVSESSLRRYVARFERFFRYEDRSRGRRYHPECQDTVLFIQQLYSDGLDAEAIEEALVSKFAFVAEDQVAVTSSPSQHHQMISEEIVTFLEPLVREIDHIRQENSRLQEQISLQHEKVMARLDERDQALVATMRAIMDERKESVKPWWKKLFGR